MYEIQPWVVATQGRKSKRSFFGTYEVAGEEKHVRGEDMQGQTPLKEADISLFQIIVCGDDT